jgi:protocatechuate 3,4-dioxygenase beta subunit
MRNLKLENITQAVIDHADAKVANPRLLQIYSSFVRHMHAFVRDVQLTEPELQLGRQFFTQVGRPHGEMADGEMHMISDVIGVSSLVELLHDENLNLVTETNFEGPLYIPNAPERKNGDVLGIDPDGAPLFMSGRALSEDGRPITGAIVDAWQPNSKGLYDVQDPTQPEMNLRGKFRTDADGRYWFQSVVPLGYDVPSGGPSGEVLRLLGRHTWRPAHIHFMLSASGHVPLTTMTYVEGSKYIDSDTTFSVKTAIIDCKLNDDPRAISERGTGKPFYTTAFDFVLRRAATARAVA